MSRRMWVLAVLAWVGVVIAGSALTWIAIDRAGQQVTGSPASTTTTQPPVIGTVGPPPTGPTPSAPGQSGPSASTSAPLPTTSPSPTHAPTTRPGTSTPRTSSPPVTRTETRTWSGTGGWLTVSCTGGRATLKSASPNDGWSFERGDDAGDAIEVKFEGGDTEVKVRATCVAGVPQFHVESSTSGGDDG